jgi:hypothetical protein
MKPQYRNQTRVFDLFGELKPPLQARQSELTPNNSLHLLPSSDHFEHQINRVQI